MVNYEAKDYKGERKPTWCPGCGNYAVLSALNKAMSEMNYTPDETTLVSGIGCSSRFPFFTGTYGFHTIHGRALPVSMGLKQARPDINVVTLGGDGDGLSIGGNHFIHAARKNPDITYIMMDNEIYALTKGQCSPTSRIGTTTKCNPYAWTADRINPVLLAISFNASFVARGYSGNVKELEQLIYQGLQHKGFSFIHIISPCVQYNKVSSYEHIKEITRPLSETHDPTDRLAAMGLAFSDEAVFTGVFYKIDKPCYEERFDDIIKKAQACSLGHSSIKEIAKQFT